VQETAGKRSGYGDLSAAAGMFLKPQLLLDGMRALVALSAKRCFVPHPAVGSASIVVA
jgi:hypothetical protein